MLNAMMTHGILTKFLQDEGFGGDSKTRNGRLFVYELIIQRDCKEGEYKFMTWSFILLASSATLLYRYAHELYIISLYQYRINAGLKCYYPISITSEANLILL